MKHPTPSKTQGLVAERPELEDRGLGASRGQEARREEDSKREQGLYDKYLAAEAELDRMLRAHRGGHVTTLEVGEARAAVTQTWAKYYKSKTGRQLRKGLEAVVEASDEEVIVRASGAMVGELPEVLEKAARKLKGDDIAKIGEPGFFANKHLQRLYVLMAKKGIELIRQIEILLESELDGLRMETKAKMKKSNDTYPFRLIKAIEPLSSAELERLAQEVMDKTYAFNVNFMGWEPDEKTLARLRKKGLVMKDKFSFPANAYTFQRVVDVLEGAGKKASKVTFKQMLEMARNVPLTRFERDQVTYLEQRAAMKVRGLGEGIARTVQGTAAEAEQIQRYRQFIRETAREGALHRWSWKDLASEFGRRTGDWARDWDRIARTELQNATQHAAAGKITRDNKGEDAYVYKMPRRDACNYCIQLYLVDGDFEKPRIYRISTMVANGSNAGRKVAQWKPTVEVAHPNCFVSARGGEVPVYTPKGLVPMKDINVGDLVLTHNMRFRKVTENLGRNSIPYRGVKVEVKFKGIRRKAVVTEDHLFMLPNGDWVCAEHLRAGDSILGLGKDFEKNPYASYETCEWQITKVRKYKSKKASKIWSLEVAEDHSYVGMGILNHNCNCALHEFVGKLGGKVKETDMGEIKAEKVHVFGSVEPDIGDSELAKKLLKIKITLDGVPLEELR